MTFNQQKQYDQYLAQRVADDLDERSLNGTYIYFMAWVLVGGGTGFHKTEPFFFWTVSTILLASGLFRLGCHLYFEKFPTANLRLRTILQYVNIYTPTLVYSYIFALTFTSEEFKPLFLYILMIICALLRAGTSIFAPRKLLSISFIFMLIIPAFFAALIAEQSQPVEAILLTLYAIYMSVQASRLNREYMTLIEQHFQLRQLNQQDGLTGIANRRCFDQTLELFWNTHLRTQAPLSLLLIDIDHFKQVNDTYGHAAGDEVIIEIASILKRTFRRETDLVARIGGEEFGVLIAVNKLDKVQEIAERICSRTAKRTVEHDEHDINVTISIGIASTTPDLNKNTTELYKLADQCLYRAKRNGRNRVEYEYLD